MSDAQSWVRQCLGKKVYFCDKQIDRMIDRARQARGVTLRSYFCKFCSHYHLTSQPEIR